MTPPFDGSHDMHREHQRFGHDPLNLDDETVDGILRGDLSGADVPQPYRAVAQLLGDVSVETVERSDETETVTALMNAAQEPIQHEGSRRMIGKILTMKAAAVAAGAVLSFGGVAAAATDNLPDPIQGAASDAAHVVGIDIPAPGDTTSTTTPKADDSTSPSTTEVEHGTETEVEHGTETEAEHGVENEAEHGVENEAEHGTENEAEHTGSTSPNSGKGSTSSNSGKGSSSTSTETKTTSTTAVKAEDSASHTETTSAPETETESGSGKGGVNSGSGKK